MNRRLPVGVIGDATAARALAEPLVTHPDVEVVGQAGMPEAQAQPGINWFDDPRVLVAQPGLQAIWLASSPRLDAERTKLVAERDVACWRRAPLATNFAEAVELVRAANRAPAVIRVASWWEYLADEIWTDLQWPEGFEAAYAEVTLSARGPGIEHWQASRQQTAGGVLACDTYNLLETLIAIRGLPETILAATGRLVGGSPEARRETEDAALAILRYPNGGLALIRAVWDLAPPEQRLLLAGPRGQFLLTPEEVVISAADGQVVDQQALPHDDAGTEMRTFIDAVRTRNKARAATSLERHLAVSALLETVYLAAQTGHPESPGRLFALQGLSEPRS